MIRLNAQKLYGPNGAARANDARDASPRSPGIVKSDSVELSRGDRAEAESFLNAAQLRKIKDDRALEARRKVADGDRQFEFENAIKALPKNARGEVKPELLVGQKQRSNLTQAVDRLMMEGLGSTAEAAFEKAVNSLFAEYADDLGLDEKEIDRARELMLSEVREAVQATAEVRPWSPDGGNNEVPEDLELAIEKLQARILDRRQFMMEASGDLSRVLAELVVDAQAGSDEAVSDLGEFLERFGDALRSRSNVELRDQAKDLMLDPNGQFPANSDGTEWGEAFLDYLKVS